MIKKERVKIIKQSQISNLEEKGFAYEKMLNWFGKMLTHFLSKPSTKHFLY